MGMEIVKPRSPKTVRAADHVVVMNRSLGATGGHLCCPQLAKKHHLLQRNTVSAYRKYHSGTVLPDAITEPPT